MPDQYSIVIVDDHALFAQALKTLINTFDKYHVLYHVKNGEELIEKLSSPENVPDICLLDINMPVMNGIETMQWLTRHKPQIKGLALSMDDEETTVIRMLRAGAHGYLLKDINPAVLQDAFRDVLEKGFYYSDKITNTVLSSLHRAEEETVLKDREIEFLKLVCSEKTYKEIAADMFLSPKTIDGYREALFEKLQIKSRVGLVIYAIKNKVYKVE
ncbi:response regulator transcription factor [Fulvivirgaceae bacterium PWU5]|uniref:Response regulator transcription factor n=1 Tax=Dawidia cretensis TaxID=2782350 RepID=A0AAP2GPL4_9BACT|nr:response regulator transcription factor [Dawidia cretensis]MBT1708344.1 response regulator transcription factor [Dawidia cretensis]